MTEEPQILLSAKSNSGLLICLVGGLEHDFYDFPFIGNVIIPTDELHHFSEGRYTTSQYV